MHTFEIKTHDHIEFLDITKQISQLITEQGWQEGICTIYTPHTTAGITINENADPDLKDDLVLYFSKMIPALNFQHGEGNTSSHIQSSLVGCSQTVIIDQAKPVLGIWQAIYFCEFDGPRNRKFYVQFTGK